MADDRARPPDARNPLPHLWPRHHPSRHRPRPHELRTVAARRLGFAVVEYLADWSRGRRAGPERNARMLAEGKPDRVLGFHRDLRESRGTRGMFRLAYNAGLSVQWVSGPGSPASSGPVSRRRREYPVSCPTL